MSQIYDVQTEEQTLNDGQAITLDVLTDGSAREVILLVDDGTSQSSAGQYNLLCEIDPMGNGAYQQYDYVTGKTALSWMDPAVGKSMRYTIRNSSGASGNYRFTVMVQR